MLKIKDNVDLKELEKFGMKYNGGSECWVNDYDYETLIIFDEDRRIFLNLYIFSQKEKKSKKNNRALSILYDLIKADLIEEVENE